MRGPAQVVHASAPRQGTPSKLHTLLRPSKECFSSLHPCASALYMGLWMQSGDRTSRDRSVIVTETDTLGDMDRVRFGRALGVGARAAAKSLMSAAEAAAAPTPNPATLADRQTPPPSPRPAAYRPPASRVPVSRVPLPTAKAVKAHAGDLKRSVWSPFARFSSVLWLEVTGTFFAIFALIAGQQVWKSHSALRLSPAAPEAQRLYVYALLFAIFAYFTISSFIRANRRQRR